MPNTLYDSFLNPVKFHQLDNVQPAGYFSRFMDDWAFRRTIQPWQQKVCFLQPWSVQDSIRLQYTSNFGPFVLRLYNEDGQLQNTVPFDTKQQDELRPTFYIRQVELNLTGLEPGRYFLTRDAGGAITYSEPFEIIADPDPEEICLTDQDPTVLIEYSHYEPAGGLKFFAPFEPMIRVPGIVQYKGPGSRDNIYEDQLLNQTLIHSVPFRTHEFILGGNYGVPPWLIDKVARILSLSEVSIDGRLYTKNEGANFEPTLAEFYPMKGWVIELREKLNRDSQVIENDIVIEGIAAAALMIDSKGFGLDGGDTNYQEINSLQ